MKYLPTIDLDPQVRLLLAHGALRLQPGQWVRDERGRVGRFLRTNGRTGSVHASWVRPDDTWASAAGRFHRACIKGFVGRYRPLYDRLNDRLGGLDAGRRASRPHSAAIR
ncbi:hypothetical protein [Arenibaculum sp.]|jgi:hypothetical protein|uniref:hypothetical protein n=1 Tax=Arenibaculum sp. TaxID=2865862 RepID=UPI002E160A7F|nr:hypothetical protein [Arenibaculum sp.]